jgi:adenosylcobinamide-GDP ribazoletransferase
MKDPHIGTYGVLALVCYLALLFASLYAIATSQFSVLSSQLNTPLGGLGGSASQLFPALVIFAGDAYSKMLASQIIMFLPYARTEETAKNHTVYRKMSLKASIILFIEGILPMVPLFWTAGLETALIFVPCLVMYFLFYQMNRKIQGYTGDCCGALFLLTELSFYLTMTIL